MTKQTVPSFLHPMRRAAFTLMEIILVVVIIMILVGVVGPRLVGKGKKAMVNATYIQMGHIKTALQEYEINAGTFPTTAEGLDAIMEKPGSLDDSQWDGPYMDRLPGDSWKQPFAYTCPPEHGRDYDLSSPGPDKEMGTEDDIVNWQKDEGDSL